MDDKSSPTSNAPAQPEAFTRTLEPGPLRRTDAWLLALPVAVALTLLATYLISPTFYITYVLEYRQRETQVVEILTVALALLAAAGLYAASWRLWQTMRGQPGVGRWPGGPLIIASAATAAFFLAGEETNWGQTYLGFESPETIQEATESTAFNLHNAEALASPVRKAANIYLLGMYVGLPLAWMLRRRLKLPLPDDWAPAIPAWHVAWCVVFSALWKSFKDIHNLIHDEAARAASPFYVNFLEQINEQRELLITVALALFAGQCLARARRAAAITRSPGPAGR